MTRRKSDESDEQTENQADPVRAAGRALPGTAGEKGKIDLAGRMAGFHPPGPQEAVSKRLEEVNLRQPLHITSKPYEVTKKGNERDKHKQTGD